MANFERAARESLFNRDRAVSAFGTEGLKDPDLSQFQTSGFDAASAISSIGLDPEEQRLKAIEESINKRLETYQQKIQEDRLSDDGFFSRPGLFRGIARQVSDAAKVALKKEQLISEELTAGEEIGRQLRRTRNTIVGTAELALSIIQDVPLGIGSIVMSNAGGLTELVTSGRIKEEQFDIEGSESKIYKLLFGREVERDMYGRATSSKGRSIKTLASMKTESAEFIEQVGGTERQVIWGSRLGGPLLVLVEVLPLLAVDKGIAVIKHNRKLVTGLVSAASAGKNLTLTQTKQLQKAAQKAAREAFLAKDLRKGQKIIDDFILNNTDEGSAARKALQDRLQREADDALQSEAELLELASSAGTFDEFADAFNSLVRDERAAQRTILSNRAARIATDPTFISAQDELVNIFSRFGDEGVDITEGVLRPDTPQDVVDAFDDLITRVKDIEETQLGAIERDLRLLDDSVRPGEGVYDISRPILNQRTDVDNVEDILRDIFDRSREGRTTALRVLDGSRTTASLDEVELLDSMSNITNLLQNMRRQNIFARNTVSMNELLSRQAAVRGITPRRELLAGQLDERGRLVRNFNLGNGENLRNIQSFNNILTAKAIDDVLNSNTFEEFLAKSTEVMYFGPNRTNFTRSERQSIEWGRITGDDEGYAVPWVLDIRQPLDLTDLRDDAAATIIQRFLSPADRIRLFPSRTVQEAEQNIIAIVEALMPRLEGRFDGIIYNVIDEAGEATEMRKMINPQNKATARDFYDAIKAGKEAFDDVPTRTRIAQEIETDARAITLLPDSLTMSRMVLPLKGSSDNITAAFRFGEEGFPSKDDVKRTIQEGLLGRAMINRTGDEVFEVTKDGIPTSMRVHVNQERVLLSERMPDGEVVFAKIDDTDSLTESLMKEFEDDAVARLQNSKNLGVTEAAFVDKGPGHSVFNKRINDLAKDGIFLPEEVALLREVFIDTDDAILASVAPLRSTKTALDESMIPGVSGQLKGNNIAIRQGLMYRGAGIPQDPRTSLGTLGSEIFFHEYAHYGHRFLLTLNQQKQIRDVFNKMKNDGSIDDFFQKGASDATSINHYARDEHEFFAQAFAEYVLKNRVADSTLLSIFKQITRKLGQAVSRLLKREDPQDVQGLYPMFDQLLRGQRSSSVPVEQLSEVDVAKRLSIPRVAAEAALAGKKTDEEIHTALKNLIAREYSPAEIDIMLGKDKDLDGIANAMLNKMGYKSFAEKPKKIKTPTKEEIRKKMDKAEKEGVVGRKKQRVPRPTSAIRETVKSEKEGPKLPASPLAGVGQKPPRPTLPRGVQEAFKEDRLLTAKLPPNLGSMSVVTEGDIERLIQALEKENIWGKGVRRPGKETLGQKRLVGRLRAMQRQIEKKNRKLNEQRVKAKEQKKKELDRLKEKMKDQAERKAALNEYIDMKEKELKDITVDTVPLLPGEKPTKIITIDKATNKVLSVEEVRSRKGTGFSRGQAKSLRKKVSKANTVAQAAKVTKEVDEYVEAQIRKHAGREIQKMQKRLQTNDIHPEWQDKIEERLKNIRFVKIDDTLENKLTALRTFLEAEPEKKFDFKSLKTKKQLKLLDELDKKPLEDISTDDLLEAWIDVEKLAANGRLAQSAIWGFRPGKKVTKTQYTDIEGNIIKDETITFDTKVKGYIPGIKDLQQSRTLDGLERAGLKGKIKNLDVHNPVEKRYGVVDEDVNQYHQLWSQLKDWGREKQAQIKKGALHYLSIDRVFELADDMNETGALSRAIRDPLRKAINRGEDNAAAQLEDFNKTFKNIEKKYDIRFQEGNFERIAIHAYWRSGATDKLLNSRIPQSAIDAAKKLQPHEQELYEKMRRMLDALYPDVDRVMREAHGERIGFIENYFPIQNARHNTRLLKRPDGTVVTDIPDMKSAMLTEFNINKRGAVRSFTKQRNTILGVENVDLNSLEIFKKYIRDANYFIEAEEELQRVSRVIRDPRFRNIVGSNFNDWVEGYIDIVARRGIPQGYNFNWLDTLRKNVGAATLGFNPSPIVKQPLAIFPTIALIGPGSFFDGVSLPMRYAKAKGKTHLQATKDFYDAIGRNSVEMRRRAFDDPAYTDASIAGRISDIQEAGYRGIKAFDNGTARMSWMGAYLNALKKRGKTFNMDDFIAGKNLNQSALTEADRIIRKTQGSGKFHDLPTMLTNKNKKIWSNVFQFQTFVLGQSQVITHDIAYKMYDDLIKAGARGDLASAAGGTIGMAMTKGGVIFTGIAAEMYVTYWLAVGYGTQTWEDQIRDRSAGEHMNEMMKTALPPYGVAANLFTPNQSRTGVPIIDRPLNAARSLRGALTKEDAEARSKDATRVLEGALGITAGIPGTGFAGSLSRGQRGIEAWFKTPSEELRDAIIDQDKAEAAAVIQRANNQGLDVQGIIQKAQRMVETEKKADRKHDTEQVINIIDSGRSADAKRERLRELYESGTLTDGVMRDVVSHFRSELRKEQLGE